jgi:hypothetical protein
VPFGLIPTLKEQLDALQTQAKFRLSQLVYQEVKVFIESSVLCPDQDADFASLS